MDVGRWVWVDGCVHHLPSDGGSFRALPLPLPAEEEEGARLLRPLPVLPLLVPAENR